MKKKINLRLLPSEKTFATLQPNKNSKKLLIILLGLILMIYIVLVTVSSTDQIFSFKHKYQLNNTNDSLIMQSDNLELNDTLNFQESSKSSDFNETNVNIQEMFGKIDEGLTNSTNTSITLNEKCKKLSLPSNLNITDIYWQVTKTSNGTFYLYNAYYDDRVSLNGPPVIRILGFIDVLFPKVKTFCQFRYENVSQPLTTEAYEYRYIWYLSWGENKKGATPYLISCLSPLPEAPKFVSLVEHKCGNANNLMEVRNKRPENKNKFIVSVKKLDYAEDISMQIIEWLEIVKILGTNKVEVFVLNVHRNVMDVLRFYESEEFVKIKPIKFPSDLPSDQNWHQQMQNELIAYHDTFYENLHSYDFLLPMDTDEFIIPLKPEDRTWTDLLNRTARRAVENNKSFDSFPVDNHYFLLKTPFKNLTDIPGVPKNLYFLSNIFRAANFTPYGGNAKTFMRMDRVLTIHNHFPFSCVDKSINYWCENFSVDREDGQLSHYRHECTTDECKESLLHPVGDNSLYKYKDEILSGVKNALEKIKIFTGGKLNYSLD